MFEILRSPARQSIGRLQILAIVFQPVQAGPGKAVPDGDRHGRERRDGLRRTPGRAQEIHDRGAAEDLRLPGRLRAGRILRTAVGAAGERGAARHDDAHRDGRARGYSGEDLGRSACRETAVPRDGCRVIL